MGAPPATGLAEEALRLAEVDPHTARDLATRALEQALAARDMHARSLAEQALGFVARETHDIPAALQHLRRSVRTAEGAQLTLRAAHARMSLCVALAWAGRTGEALAVADKAARSLRGVDAAKLAIQRAGILERLGRLDEALALLPPALRSFRRSGERLWEARLRNNRGIIRGQRAEFGLARADLHQAVMLFDDLGLRLSAAEARYNLGWLAATEGDTPEALRRYDEAEHEFVALGYPPSIVWRDRCIALISVRLGDEAVETARRAVEDLGRQGMAADAAEARLHLARAALIVGRLDLANSSAQLALREFSRQHRAPWRALARHVIVRAQAADGSRAAGSARLARRTADDLAAFGWPVEALDALLVAAEVEMQRGRVTAARKDLERASRARHRGPIEMRVRAWHAQALLRLADGRRRGAEAALRAGNRVVGQYRGQFGATELRAQVGGYGVELAALGLRMAIEERNARRALAWAERSRAAALINPPARPPHDARMRADLARLRRAQSEIAEAGIAGSPTGALLAKQAHLESAIQQRARHARGTGLENRGPVDTGELVDGLRGRCLIEFLECENQLHAVVVRGGRARLHQLGPIEPIVTELRAVRAALRRVARGRAAPASLAAAAVAVRHGAEVLDGLLLRRILLSAPLDEPIVVVPLGPLHALPWSLLPTCHGRPVVVAPSATVWLTAEGTRHRAGGTTLVAGPDLAHAREETADLRSIYPDATSLSGPAATAAAVCAALDGARMGHVACHGHFRADNPLFSSLALTGGPLTIYDLERLRRPPSTLVLSACDSGLSDVRPGNELMGLAAALLGLGTRTLIASVAPVPDAATRRLMVGFHSRVVAGTPPATALAEAQAARSEDLDEFAVAASFVCFGAG